MFRLYAIFDFVSNNTVSLLAHRTDEEAKREFKLGVEKVDPVHAKDLELIFVGSFDSSQPYVVPAECACLIAEGSDYIKEVQ